VNCPYVTLPRRDWRVETFGVGGAIVRVEGGAVIRARLAGRDVLRVHGDVGISRIGPTEADSPRF
jgi:hypothetical protein